MNITKLPNNLLRNLSKAYVEGVYNDSPLNRKLGRVGMSYKEYMNVLKERGEYQEQHTEKRDKNKIPVNIGDLEFDKNGKAHYEVDGKNVDIILVSHIKHGEKNFTLSIDGKEYTNLNTTQLTRKLKAIAEGEYDFTDSNRRMSDNIPLSAEEFDDLYGDIGFNYTYYKDNLDIKVWIREDSNKKDPHFNIYVTDTDTKKKKSFTNLSLLETHNKLLEYDLNPDVEKPLSKEQLKEFKRIQREKGLLKENNQPSKDIGIEFNKGGNAYFNLDDGFCRLQVSPEDNSLINVFIYNKEGELVGFDYTSVDNFDNFKENFDIDLKEENQAEEFNLKDEKGYAKFTTIKKPLKEIIENYPNQSALYTLLFDLSLKNSKEQVKLLNRYSPTEEDEKRLSKEIFAKRLGKSPKSKRDWNEGIRNAYVFINSQSFINWLNDMPSSHKEGVTKKQIYNDLKKLSERFSPAYTGNIENLNSIKDVQNYIIKKYY